MQLDQSSHYTFSWKVVVSFLFHPLLIFFYLVSFYTWHNSAAFVALEENETVLVLIRIFITTVVLPLVAILMMKFIGMIPSLRMQHTKDRIGPLIAVITFYIWMAVNLYYHPEFPYLPTVFILGSCIALSIAFFLNLFTKISLHAMGMGGLTAIAFIGAFQGQYPPITFYIGGNAVEVHTLLFLSAVLIISGIICSARLALKDHQLADVAGGFVLGLLSQLTAVEFFFP